MWEKHNKNDSKSLVIWGFGNTQAKFCYPFQSRMQRQEAWCKKSKKHKAFGEPKLQKIRAYQYFSTHQYLITLHLKCYREETPKYDLPSDVLAAFCAIWRTLAGEESPVRLSGGPVVGLIARAGEDRAISGGLVARRALGGGGEGETLLRGPGL